MIVADSFGRQTQRSMEFDFADLVTQREGRAEDAHGKWMIARCRYAGDALVAIQQTGG